MIVKRQDQPQIKPRPLDAANEEEVIQETSPPHIAKSGFADNAAHLSRRQLAVDGWVPALGHDGRMPELFLELSDGRREQAAECIWYRRRDLPSDGVAFMAVWDPVPEHAVGARLFATLDDCEIRLEGQPLAQLETDLRGRIVDLKELVNTAELMRVFKFLKARARHENDRDGILAANLDAIWMSSNSMQTPTPAAIGAPLSMVFDLALHTGSRIAVAGWVALEQARIERLEVAFPDGTTADCTDRIIRYPRNDVRTHFEGEAEIAALPGFLLLCDAPEVLQLRQCEIRIQTSGGRQLVVRQQISGSSPATLRRWLLELLGSHDMPECAIESFFDPLLNDLAPAIALELRIAFSTAFGKVTDEPRVSIVVPVYKGIEFVTQQIVHFARDASIAQHELIYVLDSPEERKLFLKRLEQLSVLYGVGSRALVLNRNSGFAAAVNAGVQAAKASRIVILNQDVVPESAGWVDSLSAQYDQLAMPGAIGPVLLYEDESIQHAGMYFAQVPGVPGEWHNFHYFKGYHRDTELARTTREVPAVTGACLMIDRAHYEAVGGLDIGYVQGDFEDSDLCLKLRMAGRKNWICGNVRLYHFERQSFSMVDDEPWRRGALRYNAWRHCQRWASVLAESVA